MKCLSFIQQHPLFTYILLCFTISWGSTLVLLGPTCIPATPDEAEEKLPFVIGATLAGPSISGLAVTFLAHGESGLKGVWDRMKWRKWYVLLATFAPVAVGSVLTFLSLLVSTDQYVPQILSATKEGQISMVSAGVIYGVTAGIFEEIGWSGFAIPEMRAQGSVLESGIALGLVWGFWHFLVALWGSGTADGKFSAELFVPWIPWNLLVLPAYRVLMVYVYDRSESILSMAVMHGALTASLPLALMPPATGMALASFYSLFAVALGIVVEGLLLANDGILERVKVE